MSIQSRNKYGNSIQEYKIIEEIGVGGFAKVFKARCLRPGYENKYFAIKQISKVHGKVSQERVEREIEIHSGLPYHPAFVEFKTSFEDENYWYLVLEFCAGGSFESYIKKKRHCSEEEAARLIEEVICGVQTLHHNLIVHRDLTLRNLLLTENLEVKIADFGLAVKLNHNEEKKNTCLGTPNFMSPEVVNNESHGFKTDCWSVGCVLYALLYGAPPFNNKKLKDIAGMRHFELVFPPYASTEAKELLIDMLNTDQGQRIEIGKALGYAFFQKYNKKSSKIQSSQQRSGDSGLSSLSSSGSHRNKSDKKVRKSKDASTSVSRYNSLQNILSESQKHNYFSPLATSCQSSPSSVNQRKARFQTLPSRLESQIETPIKKYPECPKYPSELEYLTKRNMSSHIYCSDQQSIFNNTHFERNNDSINHMHGKNSYVVPKSGEENASKESSCSHVEYSPSDNCIHKLSRCSQRQQYSSHHLFENSSKDSRCLQSENTVTERCLTDNVTPLNTTRLSSRRKEFENKHVVVSILSDGQVCLEFFRKDKKLVHQVYFISQDGFQITVYKLKKKIPVDPDKPPEVTNDASKVEYYTFENLPERPIHWKRYQFAKYIVDKVRSITPKVTIHGEHGTCIMMENSPNPNFEMNFYDGFQITESNQDKVIKDKNGQTVTKKDENIRFMLKDFEKMKEQCFKIENIVETYLDSYFPITCKKKPEVYKRSVFHDIGKENIKHSSSLDKQASIVKPREVTITVDYGSRENSHLKNSTFINSNEKNFFSGNERRDRSSLKSVKRTKEWVVAEYEDGIQMRISVQDDTVFFRSIYYESWLAGNDCPQLQDRYERDSKDILRQALSLEVKRKT